MPPLAPSGYSTGRPAARPVRSMALPRRRIWFLAVALVASSLLLGGPYAEPAYACSCAGGESTEEALRRSDAVFSGEAIRGGIEDPLPEDGTMVGGIEFRVDEAWKGVSGESAVVYGQAAVYYGKLEEGKTYTESSCAYPFEEGESYLVYASRYEDGFWVEGCGRTTPLAGAGEDLRALGSPTDRLTDTGGPPLPAVAVVALLAAAALVARTLRSD